MTIRAIPLAEALAEWLKDHKEITVEEARIGYQTVSTIRRVGQEEARIREIDRVRAISLINNNSAMDGKEAFAIARAEREAQK